MKPLNPFKSPNPTIRKNIMIDNYDSKDEVKFRINVRNP